MQKDHLGNEFIDVQAMCDYWNVTKGTYFDRKRKKWSLEECLCGREYHGGKAIPSTDHLGQTFPTLNLMLEHWDISVSLYKRRVNDGWDLEKILTTPSNSRYFAYDHLNNQYETLEIMCEHYKINVTTYYTRKQKGWSLEKILTTPKRKHNKKTVYSKTDLTDHNGTTFNTIQDMCDFYGLEPLTYQRRLERGWSKEKALTEPIDTSKHGRKVIDPFGQSFPMLRDMLEYHNVRTGTYFHRIYHDCTIPEALGLIPIIGPSLFNEKITETFTVIKPIKDEENNVFYFYCIDESGENIYTKTEILEQYAAKLGMTHIGKE